MFDISALHRQYILYNVARIKYRETEKLTTKYFRKHSNELKKDISEFEALLLNKEESKKYLFEHDVLRRYYHIKFLKDFYETKKRLYRNDLSYVPKDGRYIKIKCEEQNEDDFADENTIYNQNKNINVTFINIENAESFSIETNDEKEIDFLVQLLKKGNSYIGEIPAEDITLLMNIYDDIKNKNDNNKFTNNELYNEYIKTIDFPDITKNEILYGNLKKIAKKGEEDYKNEIISRDEYLIIKYMMDIIQTRDIDELYKKLDGKEKELFISAYKKLSSYEYYKRYQVYFRSPSRIVNDEIHLSKKKK